MNMKQLLENYIDNPDADENLDEEGIEEFEIAKKLFYALASRGNVDFEKYPNFQSWIKAHKDQIKAMHTALQMSQGKEITEEAGILDMYLKIVGKKK